MVEQPVKYGAGNSGILKKISPVRELNVWSDNDTLFLVALVNNLEKDFLITFLDGQKTQLVNNQ